MKLPLRTITIFILLSLIVSCSNLKKIAISCPDIEREYPNQFSSKSHKNFPKYSAVKQRSDRNYNAQKQKASLTPKGQRSPVATILIHKDSPPIIAEDIVIDPTISDSPATLPPAELIFTSIHQDVPETYAASSEDYEKNSQSVEAISSIPSSDISSRHILITKAQQVTIEKKDSNILGILGLMSSLLGAILVVSMFTASGKFIFVGRLVGSIILALLGVILSTRALKDKSKKKVAANFGQILGGLIIGYFLFMLVLGLIFS